MKTTQELTNESKTRNCKMTIFLVVLVNKDIPAVEYKSRIEKRSQSDEYISAIRNENKDIDYIRVSGPYHTDFVGVADIYNN